jgi:hypothetical protein
MRLQTSSDRRDGGPKEATETMRAMPSDPKIGKENRQRLAAEHDPVD